MANTPTSNVPIDTAISRDTFWRTRSTAGSSGSSPSPAEGWGGEAWRASALSGSDCGGKDETRSSSMTAFLPGFACGGNVA